MENVGRVHVQITEPRTIISDDVSLTVRITSCVDFSSKYTKQRGHAYNNCSGDQRVPCYLTLCTVIECLSKVR